jgi:hypothetical protein
VPVRILNYVTVFATVSDSQSLAMLFNNRGVTDLSLISAFYTIVTEQQGPS